MQIEVPNKKAKSWISDRGGQIIVAANPTPMPKPLPAEIKMLIQGETVRFRLTAVDELEMIARSEDRRLALGARKALLELTEDANEIVSNAARSVLAREKQPQHGPRSHVGSLISVSRPVVAPMSGDRPRGESEPSGSHLQAIP
jgi:hypothetical protein